MMRLNQIHVFFLVLLQLVAISSWSRTVNKGKETSSPAQSRAIAQAGSAKSNGLHTFEIGIDSFARSLLKTTSATSGKKDVFSPLQYPLLLGYGYRFSPEEKFAVELDYTLFPKKGPDGGTEETHILLRFPYVRKFSNSSFEWKAGAGLHQLSIKGKNGSVTLNNGSGTAVFYFPDAITTTNQFFLEAGFCYPRNKYKISTSFLLESPLNSNSRTLSLVLGFSYQIGAL